MTNYNVFIVNAKPTSLQMFPSNELSPFPILIYGRTAVIRKWRKFGYIFHGEYLEDV